MPKLRYNLAITDETLQAQAEALYVWNFAKKARKVINVLQGIMGSNNGNHTHYLLTNLTPAIKYAGVTFSREEFETFLHLITYPDEKGDLIEIEKWV